MRAAAFARRSLTVVGTLAGLASCGPGDDAGRASAQTVQAASRSGSTVACRVTGRPVALPDLPEASGVALSRRTPGMLWSLNDSGEPVVVGFDERGAVMARVRIAGADVSDWEALAVGSCPGGSCLLVADIGDNDANRAHVVIYRVPEPAAGESVTQQAETFRATYPDGANDAEAFFVTADGGLFVVTKGETGHIALYRFPQPARSGTTALLHRVVVLGGRTTRKDRVTDAAASLNGEWVALRTRDAVTFYRTNELTSGRLGAPVSFDVRELGERQGEGVALGAGGTVYLVSEGGGKRRPGTLSRIECALPS